jgi:adenine-specific DNA-methyltransferase
MNKEDNSSNLNFKCLSENSYHQIQILSNDIKNCLLIIIMTKIHELGQYFTTNLELKFNVVKMIQNNPTSILEPSIGQGDLVISVKEKFPEVNFDMYEIDKSIVLLDGIDKENVMYVDFLKQNITINYKTIIGNPPYVKTKTGNLHIDFTEKCFGLLEDNGELIFIVPSDFLKLTSSGKLLEKMMLNGTFTDIYHPNKENLFTNASIDVMIFRYCKNKTLEKIVNFNNISKHINYNNGFIVFSDEKKNDSMKLISDYFDILVGQVSGNESVLKNAEFGNIDVLNDENLMNKYIKIDEFPTDNSYLNDYLIKHKDVLISRGIRKFTEKNWFEFGLLRNCRSIENYSGNKCIYIKNITRQNTVAFLGNVSYFGGGLIMLHPKRHINIVNVVEYLNSFTFKENFLFSGRFKIGHRQIFNSYIPEKCLLHDFY